MRTAFAIESTKSIMAVSDFDIADMMQTLRTAALGRRTRANGDQRNNCAYWGGHRPELSGVVACDSGATV
jgi:hypothetical protein